MKNRKHAKVLLEYCVEQRQQTPNISGIGSNNWDELEEQIKLLTHYLSMGTIPNMDKYRESITDKFALWLLGLNTEFDELVEDLLDGRD